MYLMRIGQPGSEKPIVRLDDETYVDVSDLATDFDEAFFGSGGIERIKPIVQQR
ncbi:MAG: ureidoglycolate lyase, partial [Actinobacteria bacterium]|nr:ureidoglycolate lyase [Actinomycetota bacterium]